VSFLKKIWERTFCDRVLSSFSVSQLYVWQGSLCNLLYGQPQLNLRHVNLGVWQVNLRPVQLRIFSIFGTSGSGWYLVQKFKVGTIQMNSLVVNMAGFEYYVGFN
jgi:hypothetical protein